MVATNKPWIKFQRNAVHPSLDNFKSRCDEFPERVLQLLDGTQCGVRNQVHRSKSHLLNMNLSSKSYHSLRQISRSWTNPHCTSSRGNATFNPDQTEETPVFCQERQSSAPPKPTTSPCVRLPPCPGSFATGRWDLK